MTRAGPPGFSPGHDRARGRAQSLSAGAAGLALLHAARAHAGVEQWDTAHRSITAMVREPVDAHPRTGLFSGAPAVAFVLRVADQPRYATALTTLDRHIAEITRARLHEAHSRIGRRQLPELREFDLINGLTGIGVYHLLAGHIELLRDVLTYLVRLVEPLTVDDQELPGWWTGNGPVDHPSRDWPGGHANLGLAHGIAGPLALLAISMTRSITVAGHGEAIQRICTGLDRWRCDAETAAWWPGMISPSELKAGTIRQRGPQRPSWCYGTPGLARAQQLGGLALGDPQRQRLAEHALARCVTDDAELSQLGDTTLCHGWAGVVQSTRRAAADAGPDSELAALLPHMQTRFEQHVRHRSPPTTGDGLLEGKAGVALTRHAAETTVSRWNWDACLLLAPPTP